MNSRCRGIHELRRFLGFLPLVARHVLRKDNVVPAKNISLLENRCGD